MMDNRRTWMYRALGAVLVLFLGDAAYRRFFEEPASRYLAESGRLEEQQQQLQKDLLAGARQLKQLDAIEAGALPSNVELARSGYTTWLLEVVERCGFQAPRVDSTEPSAISMRRQGSRQSSQLGSRIGFSVRGTASLAQVVEFLHAFYSANHLHKIRSLSLVPRAGGALLDVVLDIDTLSLRQGSASGQLSQATSDRLRREPLSAYREIAKRNLLRVGGGQAQLSQIRLTGVTLNAQGQREAWFTVGNNQTWTVSEGDVLPFTPVDCRITQLSEAAAQAVLDGQEIHITIGDTLAQAAAR